MTVYAADSDHGADAVIPQTRIKFVPCVNLVVPEVVV